MEDIIKKTTGFVVSDKESENILFMPQNTSSPKLTIQEQIEHMKQQGILFNIVSEEEAIEFLKNNNYYFKIKIVDFYSDSAYNICVEQN